MKLTKFTLAPALALLAGNASAETVELLPKVHSAHKSESDANSEAEIACQSDVKTCPDGQTLNRDPMNNCEFPLCQGEKECTSASSGEHENYLICANGLTYRDGFNHCQFQQCPDPRCMLEDYRQCPAPYLHVYVARDPRAGPSGCADYLPCPGGAVTPYKHSTMSGGAGIHAAAGLFASAAAAVYMIA